MSGQRFGLSASVIGKIHGVLAQHPLVRKAVIYGSRAKGNYKPGSDIDLSLFAAEGQEISHRELASILDEIDDLLLPYTMDLSAFEQLNHDKLREHIERVGQVFYEFVGVGEHPGAGIKAGWQAEKLGSVCAFLNRGISPKYIEQGGISILNQRCIRDHRVSYELSRRHDAGVKPVGSERFIQVGDVLVNSTGNGTLGRVAQIRDEPPEQTTVDSHVTIVRPIANKFFPDFFGYMLVAIEEEIKKAGEGCGGQTELARSVLTEKFTVSYPTCVHEQQRIAAILDEAFCGIAIAKANAENNLQNARALFESHLHSIFTEQGEGWVEAALGDVCAFENGDRGKNYPNRNEYVDSGIPWINTGHIQPDGSLSENDMNFITKEKFDTLRSGKIQPGDLVYCLRGATLGKTALVEPFAVGAVASSLVIIRPRELMDRRFLYYFLTSPMGKSLIKLYDNGAAQPNLGAKSVAKYNVPLPKVGEQKGVVKILDALVAETQRLESLYQQKLTALDALKKSLLHQAFSGHL